jgi:hypothetical protein
MGGFSNREFECWEIPILGNPRLFLMGNPLLGGLPIAMFDYWRVPSGKLT